MDDYPIGKARIRRHGIRGQGIRRPSAAHPADTRRQGQTHTETCSRIAAESLDHCQKYTWSRQLNNRLQLTSRYTAGYAPFMDSRKSKHCAPERVRVIVVHQTGGVLGGWD